MQAMRTAWLLALVASSGCAQTIYSDAQLLSEGDQAYQRLDCARASRFLFDGVNFIQIEALRRIQAGEELFLDYGLDAGDGVPEDFPCRCGDGLPRFLRDPIAAPSNRQHCQLL